MGILYVVSNTWSIRDVVKKLNIKDEIFGTKERRKVGSWNLTDSKGYLVSVGTYLVRGVVTTSDGKKEKISVMIGVK